MKGIRLRFRQLRILFRKKFLYTMKDYFNILKRIIIPSLIAILLTRLINAIHFEPHLVKTMVPSIYLLHDEGFHAVLPRIMLHRHNLDRNDDFYKIYYSYIHSHKSIVIDSEHASIVENLLEHAKNDIMQFRRELLAGFLLRENDTVKIMHNLWAIHSLPIAISIYSNALLRSTLEDDKLEIITYSHPLPSVDKGCDSKELFIKAVLILSVLYFTFAFLTMDVVLYLFELSNKEIVSGFMYLQIMSGVPVWMYWFATFVFDFLFFTIVIAFRLALFAILNSSSSYGFFKLTYNFGFFVMVIFLFGMSGLIYMYIFSFFYKSSRNSYYANLFVFNFACNIGVVMTYSFHLGPNFTEAPFYGMFKWNKVFFIWIPFLNFPWTVLQYISQWYHNNYCSIICSKLLTSWCIENNQPKPYLEFASEKNVHAILLEVIFLFITFVFGAILFILINAGITDFLHNFFKSKKFREEKFPKDEDVIHEKEEIDEIKQDESKYLETSLLADGLGKSYAGILSSRVAVDDVSFIAERGSTFGILGAQHAGKTTTFHMMAGKIIPTKGVVSVDGVKPSDNRKQYFSMIGYCPETSPLLDKFTGRQMLHLIVSLKGIRHVETIVNEWIAVAGLEELQNVECDLYPNGKKRTLSVSLSLIGNPQVVLLDEPVSGVDSITRRRLYDIINQSRHSGKTVILGSSSANECELLCDRLTILINGAMQCIGNPHDLKNHHSLGYFLIIKVHPDITSFREVVRLEKHILIAFSSKHCRLLEEYRSMLHYQVLDNSLPLSTLFQRMEEIKRQNPVIEEYMVSTTTIQDILESFSHPTD